MTAHTHTRNLFGNNRWERKAPTGEIEGETEVLTHEEVLALLTEMARKGSVTAAVALERALRRDSYPGDIDDELDRILETKGED